MKLPRVPRPERFARLSPSRYESALSCMARAAGQSSSDSRELPVSPAALLGRASHQVLAAAGRRGFPRSPLESAEAAESLFGSIVESELRTAHWLVQRKYPAKERLPFYFLQRARAVALSQSLLSRRRAVAATPDEYEPRGDMAEQELVSRDGLLHGRPDLLDPEAEEVVDYKTGVSPTEPQTVTAGERRQLLVYAYLAGEHGIRVTKGTIIRSNGRRGLVKIDTEEAQHEAAYARSVLHRYNSYVEQGRGFEEIAQPEPQACRFCPFIPLCEAFWRHATHHWREDVGVHVQGPVISATESSTPGIDVVSLEVSSTGGTVEAGKRVVLEHVPRSWFDEDGTVVAAGDTVRAVHLRMGEEGPSVVLRPTRADTAVWSL